MSIDEWMDKKCRYVHNGILFSHTKEWNISVWDNMDISSKYYVSECWRQKPYDFSHMWNLNKKKTKTKNKWVNKATQK